MKKFALFFALSLLAPFASFADDTCIAVTQDQLCIQLEWTEGPYLGAYSKNIVKFKDLKASSGDGEVFKAPKGAIQFYGWMVMNSHEHGTRPLATKILSDGVYENSKVYYMGGMMGSWEFRAKVGEDVFVLHVLDI